MCGILSLSTLSKISDHETSRCCASVDLFYFLSLLVIVRERERKKGEIGQWEKRVWLLG